MTTPHDWWWLRSKQDSDTLVCTVAHHGVCGMEYVEEAFADRCGENVVLHTIVSRPDPSQRQENSQRRAHAEEIFYLQQTEQDQYHVKLKWSWGAHPLIPVTTTTSNGMVYWHTLEYAST